MTIRDVADAVGLSVHTLRYYEKAGLLNGIPRNGGGHRRYTSRNIEMLKFLLKLRLTGMPIHHIRKYADLVREGEDTVPERIALLKQHRKAIQEQIASLQENLRAVEYKLELYEQGAFSTPRP